MLLAFSLVTAIVLNFVQYQNDYTRCLESNFSETKCELHKYNFDNFGEKDE